MVGKLTVDMAKLQLRTLSLNGDALTLTLDSAIVRNAANTGTLVLHQLHELHPIIDRSTLCEFGHPDFAIHKRKKLSYNKLTSSPMQNLSLGVLNFIRS